MIYPDHFVVFGSRDCEVYYFYTAGKGDAPDIEVRSWVNPFDMPPHPLPADRKRGYGSQIS
jgi:hypothetical protein